MMGSTRLSHRYGGVLSLFRRTFGREPALMVSAPGRVNLIGEHTDYNHGFVLPVAIDRVVVLAVAPRRDRRVLLYASNFATRAEFSLDTINRDEEQPWSNYPRGVATQLQRSGYPLLGMEAIIWGNVPIGAGLSSRAESEFVGVQCGVMDQLIALMGRRDHALLIDCQDLTTEQVPLPVGVSIVVADTMKRRDLLLSDYNVRRQECEHGAHLLGVTSLREVSPAEFAAREGRLPSPYRERTRHVISENQRVMDGVAALKQGDVSEFGRLINESHRSLRDDFEVSSPELDGVFGSRLTGAGFGGCTVSLVTQDAVEDFKAHVSREYEEAVGISAEIHTCRAEDGVSSEPLAVER
jgi:galactokinase